eukprot:3218227-Rhodomonas_salina.2
MSDAGMKQLILLPMLLHVGIILADTSCHINRYEGRASSSAASRLPAHSLPPRPGSLQRGRAGGRGGRRVLWVCEEGGRGWRVGPRGQVSCAIALGDQRY